MVIAPAGRRAQTKELAVLGREDLMAGQLIDRAGMPQVISRAGRDVMQAAARNARTEMLQRVRDNKGPQGASADRGPRGGNGGGTKGAPRHR